MQLSFRLRILLTLIPLLGLLALLGTAGTFLLYRLGGRIDDILKENYRSVRYMQELREAAEQIDSCFQLANAGEEDKEAKKDYAHAWEIFDARLADELNNLTIPGEKEAADRLAERGHVYRERGDGFWSLSPYSKQRRDAYFDKVGLQSIYDDIKKVSEEILDMNQINMEEAEEKARTTARTSLIGFVLGLALASALAIWLAWNTIRATVRPLRFVTQSALAIGAGNLDQVVPVPSNDELGQLAEAFNTMTRQLREYRQAGTAQLLRLQQARQATINSFPDAVLILDTEGCVEMANPAAQRMLGVVVTTTVRIPWQPPGELTARVQEAVRGQRPYLPEGFDHAVRITTSGQEAFLLPRILPIASPEGIALGAAVVLQDVTRFRLLDQVKSDLVATVSHELKTPLTSIRLALHLLLEEVIGPLTSKQTELLLDARDNGERLLRMVENLLDLARLEKGRTPFAFHPARPADLIRTAVDLLRPRALDKGVQIVLDVNDDLPLVGVDAERMGHALNNLLDNALTYTPAGGTITASSSAVEEGVLLSIQDNGIGIEPIHIPHIFDKFYRVSGKTAESGTGLGLAIVREVVTAHGGHVTCESTPGKGSTFRLVLPAWRGGTS